MNSIKHTLRFWLYAVLTFSFFSTASQAHHSFGLYDDAPIELKGTIVDVSWRNPHVRISFSVTTETETEEVWTLEGGASYVLKRRGIDPENFQTGTALLVAGRAHTREENLLLLQNVLLENNKEILMTGGVEPRWSRDIVGSDGNNQLEDTASQNLGLFRVWSRPLLRPITYGEDLPYKDTPIAGGHELIERLNALAQRCESTGMPGVMATPYPFQFIDNDDSIEVLSFSNNAPLKRTIYLSELSAPSTRQKAGRMGSSIGRWESESLLVVETTKIDWPYFDDTAGVPLSEDVLVTEYFTLSPDQSQLEYRMLVNDQALFNGPITVIDTEWAALGEALIHPTDCSN